MQGVGNCELPVGSKRRFTGERSKWSLDLGWTGRRAGSIWYVAVVR